MFGISFLELMVIFLLILIVMGPEKLPEVARWMGKGLREVRKASNTLRSALTMEGLETEVRGDKKRLPDKPASAAEPLSRGAEVPETAPPTSPPTAGPTGLDQLDDDQFDRMLQREYRIRQTELHGVELAAARPSDELIAVALDPADGEATGWDVVSFSAAPIREVAS